MKEKLIKLGLDLKSKGFEYWLDAIKINNKTNIKMMKLYEYLADKYDTNIAIIERCMRFSLKPAKENIIKKTGYIGKLTNGAFLKLIKIKVL